tara:strand:+ start:318 stop:671 length:354 start_codon:yes stop_codon:yes gene_type:complete
MTDARDDQQDWVDAVVPMGVLGDVDREILRYVEQLTRRPEEAKKASLTPLKRHGIDDRAITDIVLVASCFAFMNRLADGLGVTLDAGRYELAEALFGSASLARHIEWGAQAHSDKDR